MTYDNSKLNDITVIFTNDTPIDYANCDLVNYNSVSMVGTLGATFIKAE